MKSARAEASFLRSDALRHGVGFGRDARKVGVGKGICDWRGES